MIVAVKQTVAIVSGYFNPVHVGHIRMLRAASELGDVVVVIVNNDEQQILKKGRVIINEADRMEVVESIGLVDRVVLSVDTDPSVNATLRRLRQDYPDDHLIFANGGDRRDPATISEAELCEELGIEVAFGIGGNDKADNSSRIIDQLGV